MCSKLHTQSQNTIEPSILSRHDNHTALITSSYITETFSDEIKHFLCVLDVQFFNSENMCLDVCTIIYLHLNTRYTHKHIYLLYSFYEILNTHIYKLSFSYYVLTQPTANKTTINYYLIYNEKDNHKKK